MKFWREETADTSPAKISTDYFSNETGKRQPIKPEDYRRPSPGADRHADRVNADGLQ